MESTAAIASTSNPRSLTAGHSQHRKQAKIVDDWEADSDEDAAGEPQDPFAETKQEWTRANEQAPTTTPVVLANARSLPSSAYGHGLGSIARKADHSLGGSSTGQGHAAPAPPRILQRPKEAAPGSHSDGSRVGKTSDAQDARTVEQRQEQYRLARARIFGQSRVDSSNPAASKGSAKSSK